MANTPESVISSYFPNRLRVPVVLAGTGPRGLLWRGVVTRLPRFQLVGEVSRFRQETSGVPLYPSVTAAADAHPDATFVVLWPPNEAARAVAELARLGRRALVQSPIAATQLVRGMELSAAEISPAHGWVSLPGLRVLEHALARPGPAHIDLRISGLPEEPGGELSDRLYHAATIVARLLPYAQCRTASQHEGGRVKIELGEPERTLLLELTGGPSRLECRATVTGSTLLWKWRPDDEAIERSGGRRLIRSVPTAIERVLLQLLPGKTISSTLAEARRAGELSEQWLAEIAPSRPRLRRRDLALSARTAGRGFDAKLACLGLAVDKALDAVEIPPAVEPELPPVPMEILAFRAGLKPVVFLTVDPADEERMRSLLPGVYAERRDRRVSVSAQDHWRDNRTEGRERVELYFSKDPALAIRAAELQAHGDPSGSAEEIGRLVGYPGCCIAAFVHQEDRSNNTFNRYRSHAATLGTCRPWPWALNNSRIMLLPFFPCSYACAAARAWSERLIAEIETFAPGSLPALERFLAAPVLYFDHEHQLRFDGECDGTQIRYRRVEPLRGADSEFSRLAGVFAGGDRATVTEESIEVRSGEDLRASFRRTSPALGIVLPFGRASGAAR